jgi:hypothetical protein
VEHILLFNAMNKELQRYFQIAQRIQAGDFNDEDLDFFIEYSPKVNKDSIKELSAAGTDPANFRDTIVAASRALQSSPQNQERMLRYAKDAEKGKLSKDLANGIGLVLGASEIGQSIAQIQQSKQAIRKSRRPARPAVPQRDQYLQQALRQSQESTNDVGRALAPAQAQIQDQYQQDIANAKIASTGQAGAFGSYAQLAANRRNRAAGDLAPLADEIRRGQQARTDGLIGTRMNETQAMFDNNARFYGQDLAQYNAEQEAAASLGATGHSNLNNALYNFGGQLAPAVADYTTERKYRNLRNRAAAAYGPDTAEIMVRANQGVEDKWKLADPQMGSQMDIGSGVQEGYLPRKAAQYRSQWNA